MNNRTHGFGREGWNGNIPLDSTSRLYPSSASPTTATTSAVVTFPASIASTKTATTTGAM
ncbi:hypothetical protein [Microcoleus sp. Z1_B5]|uniref:hypothetical protein n=1 Tax=Microcoleus sp. Z1_B5 TaxID=3055430 RepID=UPI002FD780FA